MKHIHIIGLGWLGMPLALKLKALGFQVSGSTRKKETADALTLRGVEVYSNHDVLPKKSADVYICTIPPPKDEVTQALHNRIAQLLSQENIVFFYTSSISVYPDFEGIVTEDDALPDHPISQLEQAYMSAIEKTVILRLGGLYGNHRHPAKYLSGRIGIEKPHAPINLISDEQVMEATIRLIKGSVISGVFNVVSEIHPSRKEYYTQQCEHMGIPLPQFNMEDHRSGKTVSCKKLLNHIGPF